MPLLRALDGRSQPASAAQVARTIDLGTSAGIRRALERLSSHGICTREELGGRTLYSLNYDHVLYPATRNLLDANAAFVKRLRQTLSKWEPLPVSGMLFGSAARRDGDVESDIDILLIRPRLRSGERERSWAPRVHELRGQVRRWTGNRLQVLDWPPQQLRRYAAREERLIDEIVRDGITLVGVPIVECLEGPR